jgi:hypothetical protein
VATVIAPPWTRPAEVRAKLGRKWQSGVLLAAFSSGQPWEPLGVPIRGPAPGEIAERLGAVQEWVADWQRAGRGPLRVEYRQIGGRSVGSNLIPCRAWLDSYEQVWKLLGVVGDVLQLTELTEATEAACPRLVPWVQQHPMRTLRVADRWQRLLATVRWIDERQLPGMYVRQVDVPGVDTKFVEHNRGILTELLDVQLPSERVDVGAGDFERRYGFRRKPAYVRFRVDDGGGWRELTVRAEDFAAAPAGVTRAYVLENEITYLASPCPPGAMLVLGGGYAVPVLESLEWLGGLDLVYWGDIDTHGFVILDRMRERFPRVRSMLMDRTTLLAHLDQWVTEPNPATSRLEFLDSDEAALYADLVADRLGRSVRLEQERIGFGLIEQMMLDGGGA